MKPRQVFRVDERDMTLLKDWDEQPVQGWFWSEKYDGCRAFWDGARFWTRGGNIIPAPHWMLEEMPKGFRIDGEIWAGRGRFQTARVAVQNGGFDRTVKFIGFDAPDIPGTWDARMNAVRQRLGGRFVQPADWGVIKSFNHCNRLFAKVGYAGGEGLVLRHPEIPFYEKGRTNHALRLKI